MQFWPITRKLTSYIGGNKFRRSKFLAFQPIGILLYSADIWHSLGFRLCPNQLWIRSTGPLSSSRVSKDFAASLVSNAKWFVWQVWKSWHCTTENDFYATAVGVLLFRAASEQQTAAAAAPRRRRRRSKCRAGKKTSKGPPEALWFMEAHRKRFKFEERWGYCHLFMRTSQPMIMGCHDFCRRILILNCLTIQCFAYHMMLCIWYDKVQ